MVLIHIDRAPYVFTNRVFQYFIVFYGVLTRCLVVSLGEFYYPVCYVCLKDVYCVRALVRCARKELREVSYSCVFLMNGYNISISVTAFSVNM